MARRLPAWGSKRARTAGRPVPTPSRKCTPRKSPSSDTDRGRRGHVPLLRTRDRPATIHCGGRCCPSAQARARTRSRRKETRAAPACATSLCAPPQCLGPFPPAQVAPSDRSLGKNRHCTLIRPPPVLETTDAQHLVPPLAETRPCQDRQD